MNRQYVYFYVFDSLSDWEASDAIARINNPQFQKTPGSFRIKTVALERNTITTTGGVNIQPDLVLKELSPSNSAM